jgi:uncharacterized phage protein gp47/JayE
MITKITPVEELKKIFVETLLNQTSEVTKVSEGSVLNGLAFGVAKLGQKVLKDVAVIESHLFPDSASGQYLDTIAELNGVAGRFGAIPSTTYVRVVGDPGTVYTPFVHTFTGQGFDFDVQQPVTIPIEGYAYVKLVCVSNGFNTNVDPLTIDTLSPEPVGHDFCINEYSATGGRDEEDDELFRERIKEEINTLARGTIQYLEQILRKYNNNVLRVYNHGLDNTGDLLIGIGTVNGADLNVSELAALRDEAQQWMTMNEFKPDGLEGYGFKFVNSDYFPIDISCRVDIDASYSSDEVRKQAHVNLSNLIDHRFWEDDGVIEWIDLVNAIKSVPGVTRVLDNYFYPNTNFIVPRGKLPRFRGFLMMNLQGVILENISGTLNPFYYPNSICIKITFLVWLKKF